MNAAVVEFVRSRARFRCECCRLPANASAMPFEVEHIISRKHRGTDATSNLAFSCLHCNRHKGSDLAGIDLATSRTKLIRLFNPRRHLWRYHFALRGARFLGRTPIGRVKVGVLNMNHPLMIAVRAELIEKGQLNL